MTDLWRQLRAENVGGSEVAALFDESSYLTRFALWQYKAKLLEPHDLSRDERVQAGTHMEPGAMAWANARWDTHFQKATIYVKHPTVEGMGCTPDGMDHYVGKPVMCQVKMVDGLIFNRKWVSDGYEISHAPLEIMLQVQHEMECAQLEESWLVAVVNGNRLYRMVCKRDPEIGAMLRDAVTKFWKSIADNEPPEPDFSRDGETIKELNKRLPVIPEQDITTDYARGLVKYHMDSRFFMLQAQDEFNKIHAELEHLVGPVTAARCGEYLLKRNKAGSLSVQVLKPVF